MDVSSVGVFWGSCYTNPSSLDFSQAILSSVFANIFAAIGINLTKILTKNNKTSTIVLYTNLFNVLVSLSCLPFFSWSFPAFEQLSIIFLIGFLGAISSICYTQALRFSSPAFVAPYEYTRLLYAIPVGILFFSEYPSYNTILGALLIILQPIE